MAFDFPAAPTVGQEYASGSIIYVWDGISWGIKTTNVVFSTGPHQVPYFAEPEMYLTPFSLSSTSVGTAACSANQIWFVPIVVPWTRTFSSIAISVSAAVASSNARLALYNIDQATGRPGSVLVDAGEVTTATTGLRAITINQAITTGIYCGAVWTSAAITIRIVSAAYCPAVCGIRLGNASPHPVAAFTRNVTYGTAFANESAQTHTLQANGNAPLIGIR
jgi:hypothetical protein